MDEDAVGVCRQMISPPLRIAFLYKLVGTSLFASAVFADEPRIFWASDPVRPNETVLVQGGDLGGPAAVVELARLSDGAPDAVEKAPEHPAWTRVSTLQAGADSLKFVIPAGWKNGVFSCRVSVGGASSSTILLNAPDP